MKFLKTVICAFLLLSMINCSPYRSAFITNENDASNKGVADYKFYQPSRKYDTIFLLNGKEVSSEKLEEHDDYTSVNVVSDEVEIKRLGFDYSEVKIIIVCER